MTDGAGPKRLPDDEATRIDVRRQVARPNDQLGLEDPPTDPVFDLESLPHVVETQRIRLDQIDRRALPFKKAGGTRRPDAGKRPDSLPPVIPPSDPEMTGIAMPIPEPPLPFAPTSDPPPPLNEAPISDAAGIQPTGQPQEAPLQRSVWSQGQVTLNPADLPSALAPSMAPAPQHVQKPAGPDNSIQILVVIVALLVALVLVLVMVV